MSASPNSYSVPSNRLHQAAWPDPSRGTPWAAGASKIGRTFSKAAGFSMVELVVVMLLMATLAALALPRLTQRSVLEERGARDQMRSLIEHARQTARVQNREVCVLLAATEARVVYGTAGGCNAAAPVASPELNGPQLLQMPQGVALAGPAALRFDARGRPVANVDQNISVGTFNLRVTRVTGHVRNL